MNANAGPSEPQTGIRVPPGWRSHERPSMEEKSSSKGPQPLALPPTTTYKYTDAIKEVHLEETFKGLDNQT